MCFICLNACLIYRIKYEIVILHSKKMSQQKEEFHIIKLEEDLIRVDEEVLEEVKDVEDLVKEAKE
jgi:hypothetical protein